MTEKSTATTGSKNPGPKTQHLFWARELTQLARQQAAKKGVPDHVMAQAMLVQAWMLFTGQNEGESRKSVSGLFASSMAKRTGGKITIAQNNVRQGKSP